jgi:uncharacterized membrane protein YdjX (TVP38/TMEM64 family)
MAIRLSRRGIVGVLVALSVVCGALLVSPAAAIDRVQAVADDPVLFGVVLLGLYLVRPLFAWPTTILSVAVGYGYGFLGLPFALGGIALTTIPPFLAVRWFDRGVDVGRVGEASEQFFATAGDFRGVMAARIAPVPADVVTCAAGLGDVRLRTVIAGTVVGEIPWTVVAIAVGTSADRLAAGRMTTIGLPVTLAMLALAVILLAGPARRLLQDRGEPSSGKN